MSRIRFTKGHGTGNDFVLIADPDARLDLTAADFAGLADRRTGVGADGVIRAVRAASLDEVRAGEAVAAGAEWFMDYRNSDGSLSEMCGNGIRVFGEFLVAEGLLSLEPGASTVIGTRGGPRRLTRLGDGWATDLGPAQIDETERLVEADGLSVARPGLGVDVGNPHVVVALADRHELDALELGRPPVLAPAPQHGANVEFVVPGDPLVHGGVGRIRMRVHERGSGETRSCGTGAAAAAVATRYWAGPAAPDSWEVEVPGGLLGVRIRSVDGVDHVQLSGPAVLVFDGEY